MKNVIIQQVFSRELKATFTLREPKSLKPTNIYMVVRVNDKQIKLATGVKIYPEHWNKKKQEAYISVRFTEQDNINNEAVNNRLILLKNYFMEFKHYLCTHPNEIGNSLNLVKEFVYKDMMQKKLEVNAIDWLKKEITNDLSIKEGSRHVYMGGLDLLNNFVNEAKKSPLSFSDIDIAFIKDYEKWLLNTPDRRGEYRKTETVGKQITNLKAMLKRTYPYSLIDETTYNKIAN